MFDRKSTIEAFLEGAAAKQPTPGGGSVTALAGALAASMGEMVVNYSIGKKGLEEHRDALMAALTEFNAARMTLLKLMVEDQQAYQTVARLMKQPEESKDRKEQYPTALLASIRIPESMGATAVTILELCERVVEVGNVRLLSDLAVCADLSMASLRCAIYNVRVNLKELKDREKATAIEANMRQLLSRGAELIQRVSPRIWQRVEKEA
jgi:methenyltetrahydrofolate cyclohydrolase